MRYWLKKIREQMGLTQEQLAEKIGISQNYYSWIESGERRPSPDTAKKIAVVMNFDWVLFFESNLNSGTKLSGINKNM